MTIANEVLAEIQLKHQEMIEILKKKVEKLEIEVKELKAKQDQPRFLNSEYLN